MRTYIVLSSLLTVSCMDSEKNEEEALDTEGEEALDTAVEVEETDTDDSGTEETDSPIQIVNMTGTYIYQQDFHATSSSDDSLNEIYDCTSTLTLSQGAMDTSQWDRAMEELNEAYGEDCDCSVVVAAVDWVLSSPCSRLAEVEGTVVLQGIIAVDLVSNMMYRASESGTKWFEYRREQDCPDQYESTYTESSFSFLCNGEYFDNIDSDLDDALHAMTINHQIDISW